MQAPITNSHPNIIADEYPPLLTLCATEIELAHATISSLVWPSRVERTAIPVASSPRLRVRAGVKDVLKAIDVLEAVTSCPASDIIVSFEETTSRRQTVDSAAAAWFIWGEAQRCVACDLYATPGANLFSIAQLIRGCAAEHGRGSIAAVQHALASHTPRAPAPTAAAAREHWSKALGVRPDALPSEITAAFRRRALDAHPDQGGTREQWDYLAAAFEQARRATISQQSGADCWEIASSEAEQAIWSSLFSDVVTEDLSKPPSGDCSDLPRPTRAAP